MSLLSGAARILCAAMLMLLFAAGDSLAATWRWSVAPSGRERLQIARAVVADVPALPARHEMLRHFLVRPEAHKRRAEDV